MTSFYRIKRNDTGVGMKIQLLNNGSPVDLSGCVPWFLFDDKQITATVVNSKEGEILVVFDKYHTVRSGNFKAEIEVLYPDGRLETFPNNSYIRLSIIDDVGGR